MLIDALSKKATGFLAYVYIIYYPLLYVLRKMGVRLDMDCSGALLASFQIQSMLINRVKET